MPTKFFLKSGTIWGLLVSAFVSLLDRFGYHVGDLVAPTASALSNLITDLATFIPIVIAIRSRFVATQPLHVVAPKQLPPNSPLSKVAALVAFISIGTLGLTGCGTNGGSTAAPSGSSSTGTTTSTSAAIESALPLVRTGAAVATGAVLNFAVEQSSTRTRLANEMYSAANSVYSLTGGNFPTPAQFQSNILAFGGSQADASYAQFSTAIAALYASYYPKLVTGDTKTGTDLLNAIAGGIEDATQSYVTTPAPSSVTSF